MVEKWLQSRGNPYLNNRPVKRVVRSAPKTTFRKTVAGHFGMPIQLFKDSDRDGVANVFDCKPYNRRKQDVIHPQSYGSGLTDMYGRQENARLNALYKKQLEELQKQDQARLEELQRISGETQTIVVDNSRTVYKEVPYFQDPDTGKLLSTQSKEGLDKWNSLQNKGTVKASFGSSSSSNTGTVQAFNKAGKEVSSTPIKISVSAPKTSVVSKVASAVGSFFKAASTPSPKAAAAKAAAASRGRK